SLGVSAFHEPPPSPGWRDRVWLARAVATGVLAGRGAVARRRRRPEPAVWACAAASSLRGAAPRPRRCHGAVRPAGPPLPRLLRGLIGGALFALRDAARALAASHAAATRVRLARVGLVAGLVLAVVFAARSEARAALWSSPRALIADSAAHYPNGRTAHLLKAL